MKDKGRFLSGVSLAIGLVLAAWIGAVALVRIKTQDQTITVIAEGLSGEDAGRAKLRLPDALSTYSPDALLLLEGANDLLDPTTFTPNGMQAAINSVVDALQNMVRQGKARGARVFLATLPPMIAPRADNVIAAVPTLNARITALAAVENVRLVDLYSAIPTTAVGSDGLHLNPQGYDLMAAEWFKAIIATMEASPSTSP
jgi:lysophospholipase L1-like esterase